MELLKGYQKEFNKKYSKEFSYQFKVHKTLNLFNDNDLDYIFEKAKERIVKILFPSMGTWTISQKL